MPIARIIAAATAGAVAVAGLTSAAMSTAAAAPAPGSTLSILAGTGAYSTVVPGPAASSPTYYPQLLAADGLGNTFVAFDSTSANRRSVVKIDANGSLSYLLNSAGTSGAPTVGGAAISSPFSDITGLAADAAGNVYVSNDGTYSIYKIDTTGQLSLVAGTGTRSVPGGPLGTGAPTGVNIKPSMLAVSANGSALYFLDDRALRIGRISAGALTTVAGNGSSGAPTPGTSGSPVLAVNSPLSGGVYDGLAVDSSGDLFMVGANCVTMIEPSTNELTAVAGTCGSAGSPTPGPAASSSLGTSVRTIAVDRYDDLYIADRNSYRILKVTDPDSGTGTLSYVAGDGINGTPVAGPATSVHIKPNGLAVTRQLDVVIGEDGGTYIATVAGIPSVPDAPTGLTASAGNASASVTFSPPAEDGGRSISSYEYSINGGGTWTPLTTSGTSTRAATITGLANGTSYTLVVRAVNTVGGSVASVAATVTPQAPPPPLPPPPSPANLTSTGAGTAVQSATAVLATGWTVTLLDGTQPADVITVANVGTYRLNPSTGAISFTPVLGYTGTTAGVTFRVTDLTGRSGTAVYVPAVTKPAAPDPAPLTSSGPGTQSARVPLTAGEVVTLLDGSGDPAAAVRVREQGTYAASSAGVIVFTPVDGFAGAAAPVSFRVSDAYEQHGDSTYAATVTAAAPLPAIDRSGLAPIPGDPKKVTGPERRTKAFNASYTGIDAYPIPRLGTRTLRRGEATTLSGDGLFEFDRARLTGQGQREVKLAVKNLSTADRVRCEGYTDYAGEVSHELDLSRRRARAVCEALKQYGATITTITRGFGPKRPAVVGGTATSRKENRRVVIVVTG